MNYSQTQKLLESALKYGIDPSLKPIRKVCMQLGNPQNMQPCIQIAGTNGKSSVSRMIAAIMHAQGLRVGLYTSPELVRYPERMEINGKVVSDNQFADCIEAAFDAGQKCNLQLTEFELLTVGAFWLFAREQLDVCVLECGLGGRWDATSICSPEIVVITGIGLDHTHILGDTIEKIATEKAAIICEGVKAAAIARDCKCYDIFAAQAQKVGAKIINAVSVPEDLIQGISHMPYYQCNNLATAWMAACAFYETRGEINQQTAIEALSGLQIPGRFETLQKDPLLIIDAAHNPQSAQILADEIKRRCLDVALLLGVLADKDAFGIVHALVPCAKRVIVTQSKSKRALPAQELAALVRKCGKNPIIAPDIATALDMSSQEDVVASGSITVAGEIKGLFC